MGILSRLFRDRARDPGIYRIKNRRNGKVYIGCSQRSMRLRWEHHIYNLRCGSHINKSLQEDYDRFGELAFSFSVIEVLWDDGLILRREQEWIAYYRKIATCYNVVHAFAPRQRRGDRMVHSPMGVLADNVTDEEATQWLSLLTFEDTGEYLWTVDKVAQFVSHKGFPIEKARRVVEQARHPDSPELHYQEP